jgi:D-alanyl-D-alanine carboxypeptidase/D-alanyl-D-alanine-endopeptidase (penicillin-binding protein 4)
MRNARVDSAVRRWMAAWLLLIGVLMLVPAAVRAQDAEAQIERFGFTPEQVGYQVVDLETGTVLESGRADALFIPASTAKVPSMVLALGILGEEHRPRTEVWVTGPLKDGVLQGDLYLRGLGDPFLDTGGLKSLAAQVAEAGIREVAGTFHYDATWLPSSPLITPTQPITAGYNPGISALSVNFNRVHLEWVPNGDGIIASVYTYANTGRIPVDWIGVANGGDFGALLDYGSNEGDGVESWVHADSLSGEGGVWLPVRSPAVNTAMLFRAAAADAGITLPQPLPRATPADADLVALHVGDPLPRIAAEVLEHSNNMAAELVGLAAARRLAGPLDGMEHAVAAATAWLQQRVDADWTGFDLENFSGLSSRSRISPAQMCAVLAFAHEMEGPALFDLLKTANWEGNLNQGRSSSQPRIQVRAKTGTMAYAVGLAGYIDASSGRRLAFSVFVNDIPAREALDAVLDLRDANTPPGAKAWFNRARELERALVSGWASRD